MSKITQESTAKAADLWGFGITILEYITGKKLLRGKEIELSLNQIPTTSYGINVVKILENHKIDLPEIYVKKISSLLRWNPKNRFTYFNFKHDTLSNFRFHGLSPLNSFDSIIIDKLFNASMETWTNQHLGAGVSYRDIIKHEVKFLTKFF